MTGNKKPEIIQERLANDPGESRLHWPAGFFLAGFEALHTPGTDRNLCHIIRFR